jgi:Putative peptidoglycan binding domain
MCWNTERIAHDGVFLTQTHDAVTAYQRRNNLGIDGIAGPSPEYLVSCPMQFQQTASPHHMRAPEAVQKPVLTTRGIFA